MYFVKKTNLQQQNNNWKQNENAVSERLTKLRECFHTDKVKGRGYCVEGTQRTNAQCSITYQLN